MSKKIFILFFLSFIFIALQAAVLLSPERFVCSNHGYGEPDGVNRLLDTVTRRQLVVITSFWYFMPLFCVGVGIVLLRRWDTSTWKDYPFVSGTTSSWALLLVFSYSWLFLSTLIIRLRPFNENLAFRALVTHDAGLDREAFLRRLDGEIQRGESRVFRHAGGRAQRVLYPSALIANMSFGFLPNLRIVPTSEIATARILRREGWYARGPGVGKSIDFVVSLSDANGQSLGEVYGPAEKGAQEVAYMLKMFCGARIIDPFGPLMYKF